MCVCVGGGGGGRGCRDEEDMNTTAVNFYKELSFLLVTHRQDVFYITVNNCEVSC